MLKITATAWGTFIAVGAIGALSGAADVVMIPAVPILVLSGSTLMALGTSDWIGAYSGITSPEIASAQFGQERGLRDGRSLTIGYQSLSPDFDSPHRRLQLSGARTHCDWEVRALTAHDLGGKSQEYSLGSSYRLWKQPQALPDGLRLGAFFDVDVDHERIPSLSHRIWRAQGRIRATLWGGERFRTLSPLLFSAWAGYYHDWVQYLTQAPSQDGEELAVTAGFQLKWLAHPRFRPFWGYEHARQGLQGGVAQGYFGILHAGVDLRVLESSWLSFRMDLSGPKTYLVQWEERWF